MARCPNCWTEVGDLQGDCPDCGLPLQAGRVTGRRRTPWIVAGALLVGVATILVWMGRTPSPAAPEPATTPVVADRPPPTAAVGTSRTAARTAGAHWPLTDPDGATWQALVLHGPRGPRLLVPLDALIGSERFDWRGQPLALRVVHADTVWRYVLLVAKGPLPAGVEPLWARHATPELSDLAFPAASPDGHQGEIVVEGRRTDGLLRLATRAVVGTALLDREGHAIAYAVDPGTALPLDPVIPWLGQSGDITLAAARRELRRRDPRALIADVEAMLSVAGLDDLEAISHGVTDLALAEALAREPGLLQQIARNLRDLQIALVRVLLQTDSSRALAAGRDALARFPNDPALLATTAEAAIEAGEPDLAVQFLARLRLDSTSTQTADLLEGPIREAAERLSLEGEDAGAIALAEQLAVLLPRRADVHATLARALERAGRLAQAVAAAREATALDPLHARLLSRLAESLESAGNPDIVRIPLDPGSGAIHADVLVAGVQIPMVVDTGATLTTVPRQLAARLGLLSPSNRRVEVETAGGVVQGELVRLSTLTIGTLQLRNVSAVVLDLSGSMAGRGLLGMSALRRFDVRIDSEQGFLELRRHRPR